MAPATAKSNPGRRCFVTVGATASFTGLIEAVLEPSFLKALASMDYSQLRIQYGKDGASTVIKCLDLESIASEQLGEWHGISITGFDFRPGLREDMVQAKGPKGREGVVISHAGTGSILEAMSIQVPLIVVPNSALLHNHQAELAEKLEEERYVIHGELDNLVGALKQIDSHLKTKATWPPRNPDLDPSGKGLIGVLDDEMGFVD